MPSDTLMTIVIILIAGTLLFIVPMVTIAHRSDVIATQTIGTAITEFLDTAREEAVITKYDYESLKSIVESKDIGRKYDLDVRVSQIDENPAKKDTNSVADEVKIGENLYVVKQTYQLEEQLYSDTNPDKCIYLYKGDVLSASVQNVSPSFYDILKNWLHNTKGYSSNTLEYSVLILEDGNGEQAQY